MVGAVAANFHQGSRSEVLADYLFSSFGTVTPVRRSDDHGVDLYCTLTKRVGQRAVVTDYYSVQVKSNDDPWVFIGPEEIKWLFDHPTPLFLAHVDKRKGIVSVYQLTTRFYAEMWPTVNALQLRPGAGPDGQVPGRIDGHSFDLSAPVIVVSIADLQDDAAMANVHQVLEYWVTIERENCTLRRMGVSRMRAPHRYTTNRIEGLDFSGVELGTLRPTPETFSLLQRTTLDAIDCLGHQLLRRGDRRAATLAALFLKCFRAADNSNRSPFEHELTHALEAVVIDGRSPKYVFEALDAVFDAAVADGSLIDRFLKACNPPAEDVRG